MLSEYDGDAKDFLLRVLVDGKVRGQERFTRKDIAAAPIVMRLTPGWKVSGRLQAPVPFDRDNTPVVTLVGNNSTDDCCRPTCRPMGDSPSPACRTGSTCWQSGIRHSGGSIANRSSASITRR